MSSVKGHDFYAVERPSRLSVLLLMSIAATAAAFLLLLSASLAYPTTRLTHAVVQFDHDLVRLLNRAARQSPAFDLLVWELTHAVFVQGVMVALFWGAWFVPSDDPSIGRRNRAKMLTSLVGLYLALVLALVLRAAMPFRSRPAEALTLFFQMPYSTFDSPLHWSSTSFPSGHAAAFFALAVGLWALSARLGILGSFYALFLICVPRIYIGRHFPTDIVAGALLGVATVLLVNELLSRSSFTLPVLTWSERHPTAFGVLLFLCCLDIATNFSSIRGLLRILLSAHTNKLLVWAVGAPG